MSSTETAVRQKKVLKARSHSSQREIAAFLQALNSYPEYFERNPLLSFEQHMTRIAGENSVALASTSSR